MELTLSTEEMSFEPTQQGLSVKHDGRRRRFTALDVLGLSSVGLSTKVVLVWMVVDYDDDYWDDNSNHYHLLLRLILLLALPLPP
ncbi:hypothetical protein AK812_SmicGene14455 [Symbiodinium microadriaticum]|uniref:Uncharacterized protein n=1 Tax=Symbiodinium microadriaticum TaxID=2951 RepID=A0A1Q9E5I2_SYMMI|nr:hypothetical protein AK812_SmicGene14455 [Symbiodinium microadriaticum]